MLSFTSEMREFSQRSGNLPSREDEKAREGSSRRSPRPGHRRSGSVGTVGRDISRLRTDTFRLDSLASRFEKNKLIIDLEDRAGHLVETLEVLLKARKGRAGDETPQIKQGLEKLIEIKRVIDRHKKEGGKEKVRKSMPTFKNFMQGKREHATSALSDKRGQQTSKKNVAAY